MNRHSFFRRHDPFSVRDTGVAIPDFQNSEWDNPEWGGSSHKTEPLRLTLQSDRIAFLFFLASVAFFLLFSRVFALQVVEGDEHRAVAEGNRIRLQVIPAARGSIIDRNGVALVKNIPRFQLHLRPQNSDSQKLLDTSFVTALADILDKQYETVEQDISRSLALRDEIVILYDHLMQEQAVELSMIVNTIPGIQLAFIPSRKYPFDAITAHALGYTAPLSREEYSRLRGSGYRFNDEIGRAGLEAYYEDYLRGVDGVREVEVDSRGALIDEIAARPPVPGKALELTLDSALQNVATLSLERALKRANARAGSVVVMDPRDGAILAFATLPSFDPNLFTQPRSEDQEKSLSRLFEDPIRPLFNRGISGQYPPGSTIKPSVALQALERKIITPETTVLSTGGIQIGAWRFPDWRTNGHGIVNVKQAIADSVNTFFYVVGGGGLGRSGLGVDELVAGLQKMNFGNLTGVDIPGEESGFIPTTAWKQETRGEPWYIGDTYHLSIGQGDLLATPLQIAYATALIASDGTTPAPHFQKQTRQKHAPNFQQKNYQTVKDGMRMAITAGSGRALQSHPLNIAGKTGTAQAGAGKKEHAWFTSFAPFDEPRYAVTVFLEHAGEGSRFAVPVAQDIYDALIEMEKSFPQEATENP